MKTVNEIYNNIKNNFFKKTNIDVEEGTAIDSFMLATSDMIQDAYQEIEDNKTPYLYTKLFGDRIDNMAILCGLKRKAGETDKSFLYRLLNWNTSNKASNASAIEDALMSLEYSSHATYVPRTFGCGTCSIYIIPREMSTEYSNLAIEEVKAAIKNVISPSSYVDYIIPQIIDVKISCAIKIENADKEMIKNKIEEKIMKYINGIAPGSYFEIGEINKIGINQDKVEYFNITSVFMDGAEITTTSKLQKVNSKFLINKTNINWVEVK